MSTPSDRSSHGHHDEQQPEEPKTPFWLTALGVALFVGGGVGYLLVHEPTPAAGKEEKAEGAEPGASAKAPEEQIELPARLPRRLPRRLPPGMAASGQRPRPPMPNLTNLRPVQPPP